MKLDELAKKTVALDVADFSEQFPTPALIFLTALARPSGKDALSDPTVTSMPPVTEEQPATADVRATLRMSPRGLLGDESLRDALVLFLKGRVRDASQGIALGRGAESDYVLPHTSVSKNHAVVKLDGDAWTITDLGATNGTFVDGVKLGSKTTAKLGDGSLIGFGPETRARFFTPKGLYGFLRRYRVGMAV